MRECSAFLVALSLAAGCDGTNGESAAAHGPGLEAAARSDEQSCAAQMARAFYVQATQVDYSYPARSPEELLKRSSLVLRGRAISLGGSVPATPLSSEDVDTALKLEVEHVYRGAVEPGQPLYVTMSRSPAITDRDLASLAGRIPDVALTLFLIASDSKPVGAPGGARVFRLASPQGFLVASPCGVAQALVSEPLFEADIDSAEALHEAMLRLPSEP